MRGLVKKYGVWVVLMASCASELPRDRNVYTSKPLKKIDPYQLRFTDAYSESEVNVGAYMEEHNLKFILMLFGSVGCAKCNEKAVELSTDYLPKHELFLTSEDRGFEMIGVNTDTGTYQTRFMGIMADEKERNRRGYDFVKWQDPRGETMMKYLVGGGKKFGVPFTVLISREGIMWRYHNDQPYRVKDLVEETLATLKGKNYHGDGGGGKEEPPPVTGEFPLLAFESKHRLKDLSGEDCDGEAQVIGKKIADYDFVLLQASRDACEAGSMCAANSQRLQAAVSYCENHLQKKCVAVHMIKNRPRGASMCAQADRQYYKGGARVFEVFATHFDWAYGPILDESDAPTAVPEVSGPITLAFRSDGLLIGSWDGAIPGANAGNAPETVMARKNPARAVGMDLPVFGDVGEHTELGTSQTSALFSRAKYTVLAAFDPSCSSCMDEMILWSTRDQLGDYCKKNQGFCQVFALEGALARPNTEVGRADFYQEIQNEFASKDVTVPLLLEIQSLGEYGRIFESYFSPRFPEWNGEFGTAIYDREGKIIANFKSATHTEDPVLATMRVLKELP